MTSNTYVLVDEKIIDLSINGFIESLYASLLTATFFGFSSLKYLGFFNILAYIQIIFSLSVFIILIDKFLKKYAFPVYHTHHAQDRKLNTITLTMSIFRNDIERIKLEYRSKSRHHINVKDIESIVDGLYIAFLDIDKIFGRKNIHRSKIDKRQYAIILTNVEDSIHVLSKFIDFLNNHNINWNDRNIRFWINHILDTSDNIILHFEDEQIKNPKLIVSVENIREYVSEIRSKL
jgi:hypothetical protein